MNCFLLQVVEHRVFHRFTGHVAAWFERGLSCDAAELIQNGGGNAVERDHLIDCSEANRFFGHPEDDAARFILREGPRAGLFHF